MRKCGACDKSNPIDFKIRLQNYIFDKDGKSTIGGPRTHDCLTAFKHWVKCLRTSDPHTSEKELLICPMLWCRSSFEDAQSTIKHACTCPLLFDTWYWCERCSRPESFKNCDGTGVKIPLYRSQKKSSKLSRAKAYFKNFGRKISPKEKDICPRQSSNTRAMRGHDRSELAENCRHELIGSYPTISIEKQRLLEIDSDTEIHGMARCPHRSWIELPSRLSHTIQHELPQPICRNPSCTSHQNGNIELPGDQPRDNGMDVDVVHSQESDLAEQQVDIDSLAANNVSPVSWAGALTKNTSWFSSPSSRSVSLNVEKQHELIAGRPIGSRNSHDLRSSRAQPITGSPPTRSKIFSPMNSLPESNLDHRDSGHNAIRLFAPPPYSSYCEGWQPNLQSGGRPYVLSMASALIQVNLENHRASEEAPHPAEEQRHTSQRCFDDVIRSSGLYASSDGSFSSDIGLASMQSIIQDLRELVSIFNEEWKQRLASSPDLLAHCSRLSSNSLVNLGIMTLQRYFNGTLTNTFEEIFALVHVAFATAYMLHHEDELYCWSSLFRDMLQWKFSLLEKNDIILFSRAMEKLSFPQEHSVRSPLIVDPSKESSGLGVSMALSNGSIVENCWILLSGQFTFRIPTISYG